MTEYESWADHGVGVVEVIGDLSPDQTVQFHAALRVALDAAQVPYLVVICGGIRRLSIGPIAAVLSIDLALRGRGGRVVLAAPDTRLRRVLRLGGADGFEVYPDLETARDAVSGRSDLR